MRRWRGTARELLKVIKQRAELRDVRVLHEVRANFIRHQWTNPERTELLKQCCRVELCAFDEVIQQRINIGPVTILNNLTECWRDKNPQVSIWSIEDNQDDGLITRRTGSPILWPVLQGAKPQLGASVRIGVQVVQVHCLAQACTTSYRQYFARV